MSQLRYDPEEMLSVDEVAAWLRISIRTVRRWTKLGILPSLVRLAPRCTRWRAGDIQKFLDDRKGGE
jgi:predicted DNA-binding transcriptional regulator AlpA